MAESETLKETLSKNGKIQGNVRERKMNGQLTAEARRRISLKIAKFETENGGPRRPPKKLA